MMLWAFLGSIVLVIIGVQQPLLLAGAAVLLVIVLCLSRNRLISLLIFSSLVIPYGTYGNIAFTVRWFFVPLHIIDIVFVTTLVFLLAKGKLRFQIDTRSPLSLPIMSFIGIGVFYAIVGLKNGHEVWDVGRDIRSLLYYSTYYMVWNSLTDRQDIERLVRLFIIGSVVYAIEIHLLFLLPMSVPFKANYISYFHGQSRFLFTNSFVFIFTVPLLFSLSIHRPRISYIFGLLISLSAVLLSLKRSLVIAVVLAIISYVFLTFNRKYLPVALAILILSLVGLVTVINQDSGSIYRPTRFAELASERVNLARILTDKGLREGRFFSYKLAALAIKKDRYLGSGLGTLFEIPWAIKGYNFTRVEGYQTAIDNVPLTLLGKMGVMGLLIFYWINFRFLSKLRYLYMSIISNENIKRFVRCLMIAVPFYLMTTLFEAFLLTSRFIIVFSALLAIVERLHKFAEGEHHSDPKRTEDSETTAVLTPVDISSQ